MSFDFEKISWEEIFSFGREIFMGKVLIQPRKFMNRSEAQILLHLRTEQMAQSFQRLLHSERIEFTTDSTKLLQKHLLSYVELLSCFHISDQRHYLPGEQDFQADIEMKLLMKMAEELAMRSNFVVGTIQTTHPALPIVKTDKYLMALKL